MKNLPPIRPVDGQRNQRIVLAIAGCFIVALALIVILLTTQQSWAFTGIAMVLGLGFALYMISSSYGEGGEKDSHY
jgi:uncharacterized membrane protein YccC